MEKIIGREREIVRLTEFANSDRAEFVAVYGRASKQLRENKKRKAS